MSGFIKLHRKIRKHPLFKKNKPAMLFFIQLLMDAAWRDTVQDWRGNPIDVSRGDLMMSVREMAETYDLSAQNVRTLLNTLKSHKIVKSNTLANKAPLLITICNYSEYQSDQQSANEAANKELTKSQQTKEEEEERKKKEKKDRGANAPSLLDLPDEQPQPEKSKPDRMPILESFESYQALALRCGLPQARNLSPALRKSIGARLREYQPKGWDDCLAMIERSGFLCGQNDRDFRVNLPWMLKPANFEKIISGTYGNGRDATPGSSISTDETDELMKKIYGNEVIENVR
tara:strand:+ start:1321 stop:2187 length:867 start_codon:yes stop_codon:yes gene_type:complete